MGFVSLSDAAKLVRKSTATIARDIANGYLNKTVLQDGDVRIDTAELERAYGQLHSTAPKPKPARRISNDKTKIALLEERIRALERVIALEAELRRVKDQVTHELRARLSDKDKVIKALENKVLFLEFDKQLHAIPTLDPTDHPDPEPPPAPKKPAPRRDRWWRRLFHIGRPPAR